MEVGMTVGTEGSTREASGAVTGLYLGTIQMTKLLPPSPDTHTHT